MKISKVDKKISDEIIKNSNIHPDIKESLLEPVNFSDGGIFGTYYMYESDFIFNFINDLIKEGFCKNVSVEDIEEEYPEEEFEDDFEIMCYKWFVKYFSQYLTGMKISVKTESGYPLFTPDGTFDGEDISHIYDEECDKELDMTTDYNEINTLPPFSYEY